MDETRADYRSTLFGFTVGVLLLAAGHASLAQAEADGEGLSILHARFEIVDAGDALSYQNLTGQMIDAAQEHAGPQVAQLLATTQVGPAYLYLREVQSTIESPSARSYWREFVPPGDEGRRADEAGDLVTRSIDWHLKPRPDLSYAPEPRRVAYDRSTFLFAFVYGVPEERRHDFEQMSRDYNELCRARGVEMRYETYEILESGGELRFLVIKGSRGNADFWLSESELDDRIAGDRFEEIGLRAEAMMSSVETFTAVTMSQGRAPSPLLR